MIKCTLSIKVCNAADRAQDRHYRKQARLALPPTRESYVLVDGRLFEVAYYEQVADPTGGYDDVVVVLRQDNTTFKRPEEFTRICTRLESAGFTYDSPKQPRRRKTDHSKRPDTAAPGAEAQTTPVAGGLAI